MSVRSVEPEPLSLFTHNYIIALQDPGGPAAISSTRRLAFAFYDALHGLHVHATRVLTPHALCPRAFWRIVRGGMHE